jgi:hypothetical protein
MHRRVRQADLIDLKSAPHSLIKLQLIFEQVDSIPQLNPFR